MFDPVIRGMIHAPERLAALARTGVMDTPPEEPFDRLISLAVRTLDSQNGIIAFVDAERQFFKSRVGTLGGPNPPRTRPLGWGFCPFTMATSRALVIQDARDDPMWAMNPVVRRKGVIGYLGVPLVDTDGHVLGTMCVLDHRPREWTPNHVEILRGLAASVMNEVRYRAEVQTSHQLARVAQVAAERERWRAMQLHALAESSLLIYSAVALDATLQVITDQAGGLIGARRGNAVLAARPGEGSDTPVLACAIPAQESRASLDEDLGHRAWLHTLIRQKNDALRLSRADLENHPARPPAPPGKPDVLPDNGWLAAPFVARDGSHLGFLELIDRSTGEFTAEDEAILLQLAQIASVAIENTQLHDEQARLADAFQSILLPPRLPAIPGFEVVARHRPARRARVSGDFHDVFPLPGGAWGLAIGDVQGKG
ncbi:MAG: GAF domain-containing protein, partial [Streptomycetales bacterium]